MTDQEMHQAWNDTDSRLQSIETSDMKPFDSRRNTALDNLAQRYLTFSRLALVMTLCSPVYMFSGIIPDIWRYVIAVCLCVFFGMAGCMDYWLYHGVKSIDIRTMPVSEVVRKAIFYRRRHLQFIAILVPLAISIFTLMALAFSPSRYMIAGMVCGAVIGIVMGVRQLIAFMDDYRTLRRL